VSGAVSEEIYIGAMKKAGFINIKVEDRAVYSHDMLEDYLKSASISEKLQGVDLSDMIASYKISAVKPPRRG